MDVLLALAHLRPAPKFGGSLTANTREAYEAIRWEDERPKPSWSDLEAAWPEVQAQLEDEETKRALAESDPRDMPRAVEDLYDILSNRGVIAETDIPQAVRDKIAYRKALRAKL